MKRSLPVFLTLILAVISTIPAFSQTPRMTETDGGVFARSAGQQTEQTYQVYDDEEDLESGEDDEPVQRVARITFTDGDVGFLRAGVSEWADAAVNLPLLAGDQVYTGSGARVEIQLGRGNYIRLSENTSLTFTDLSHTAAQFEVTEGIALIRLERYGSAFERFEVDTPNAALLLQRDGFYRINVRGEEESEVIVRNGLAEVTTNDGVFSLREGQRLMVETSDNGRLEIVADSSRDAWDEWSYERDTSIDRVTVSISPSYVSQQEVDNHCFYGASELSDYGTWTNYGSYGNCWVPRVASGWAPYRSGQWIWMPRVGWSWWSNEPWGWAPYHYGRWVYLNGLGWAWAPGIGSSYYRYNHPYYQWRPALVHFFNYQTPQGHYIGWYPLRPGERWRRPDRYRRDPSRLHYPGINNGNSRPGNDRNDRNRWDRRIAREGVTVLPGEGFSRPDRSNFRPGAPDGDADRWLKKGVRAGLPEFTPTTSVTAPVTRDRDGRPRARRIIAPSREILNRPVITRNKLVDPQVVSTAPRERRLVVPKKEKNSADGWTPRDRRQDHTGDHAGDRNDNKNSEDRKDRRRVITGPVNTGNTDASNPSDNHDSSSDRDRRRKDKDDSASRPAQNQGTGSNDSNNSNDGKQTNRDRVIPFPRPRSDSDSNNKSRDNGERPRNNDNKSNDSKSNDNRSNDSKGSSAPSRPRNEDAPRRPERDNSGGSTPRNYDQPRHERPSPSNDNRDRGGSRQENAPRRKG